MPYARFFCKYCGNKWEEYIYSVDAVNPKCTRCKETKMVEPYLEKDVYGYNYKAKEPPPKKDPPDSVNFDDDYYAATD